MEYSDAKKLHFFLGLPANLFLSMWGNLYPPQMGHSFKIHAARQSYNVGSRPLGSMVGSSVDINQYKYTEEMRKRNELFTEGSDL